MERKNEGVMDDTSDESTEEDDVTGVQEEMRQRQRDWDEVDGAKQGAGSRDKVK